MRSAASWVARRISPRIQFRMLNRGKGPAVWAPRAQCDRGLYRRAVRTLLEEQPAIHTVQGTVARLIFDEAGRRPASRRSRGDVSARRPWSSPPARSCAAGSTSAPTTKIGGGRAGEAAATHLAEQLERVGLAVARFKTGTPPRIDGRSVDFELLERQESEIEQFDYSWSHFWRRPAPARRTRRAPRADAVLDHVPGRGRESESSRRTSAVGDVRRGDRVAGAALLPVGRGQDRQVPGGGAASDLSRARGARHDRAVRERALDVAAGAGAARDAAQRCPGSSGYA